MKEKTKVPKDKRRLRTIGVNVLFWLSITLLISYGISLSREEERSFISLFLQGLTGIGLLLIPIAYFTSLVLVPRLFMKRRYWQFALSIVVVSFVWPPLPIYLGNLIDVEFFGAGPEDLDEPFDIAGAFVMMVIMGISTLVNMTWRSIRQQGKVDKLENERLATELSLLRNQISPDFFFNTLNNLYALSLEQSRETPKVILKLSEMMRYTIYECNDTHVLVSKEVKYLENYIDLQQMRHHRKANIEFLKYLGEQDVAICPLVLIVFLENAFKHGVDGAEGDAFVRLQLETSHNMLRFRIENSMAPARSLDEPGGIGLENARKRLDLVYGSQYSLQIDEADGIFCVDLEIDLT
ncbi:MAG: histidine kinase [Roseivirga sp.]